MNLLRAVIATLAVFAALPSKSQTIVAWDFTGSGNYSTFAATTVAANLDSSGFNTLTRGATATSSSGANSFRTQGFKNEGISVSNTDYFEFVVSATEGYTLSLTSISANFAGTASYAVSPGVSMQFAYSVDGSNFTLIGSPFTVIGTPSSSPTVSLSGITALQNISANTSITMRFFASGQTTTGGWGFYSASSGTNGLSLNGSLTAVPEPSTYAAILGGLALIGVVAVRRRKRAAVA